MSNSTIRDIKFENEPVLNYLAGSWERAELEKELSRIKNEFLDIPVIVGGKEIKTGNIGKCALPHNHSLVIGQYHKAGRKEAELAVEEALKAKKTWEGMKLEQRVAIFLKAAELASGPWRARLNAATMLTQSKTYKQAEIDSACELVDFLRFNAYCLVELSGEQPISVKGIWNRTEYRPLEGFVFAVSPFNFTSIASNLPGAPAIAGNTVVWKPASNTVYSSYVVFKLFQEAGLPDGVINFIPGDSGDISDAVLLNEHLCGLHFTGSTKVFQDMWTKIGTGIASYRTFPRIVGETGGKNYVIAHPSADRSLLIQGLVDGAFEFQGQKCSAASRVYISRTVWTDIKEEFLYKTAKLKVGDVEEVDTFMGAVIDRKSYETIKSYIYYAKNSHDAEIIAGGQCEDSRGYFVQPTVILTDNPRFKTMEEEIFGPVLTIYVYNDEDYEEILRLCDRTSIYGLTGAVFAKERQAIEEAEKTLIHSAGNFYINVRPTGAVVGQQPFGGSRKSGTNDKAGSKFNLIRWLSPRVIKEYLA
ncbi:MAG: L-glutamate gamma-semialdehyde dehydrogenase [Sedimentibacter sp.]|uniref:L-glutamate gamma-semialdehyde dehydrogenase n=1 Tax=Sedimentibacter sp. TaxID=1960295 RepID=UPI0031594FAE